jgi:hypothetical protein
VSTGGRTHSPIDWCCSIVPPPDANVTSNVWPQGKRIAPHSISIHFHFLDKWVYMYMYSHAATDPDHQPSVFLSSSSRRACHALIAFAADERNRNAPPFSFHRHHQQGGISAAPGHSFGKGGGGEGRPGVGFLRHKRSPASGLTKEKLRGARGDWAASLRERSSFSLQPFWIDLRGIRR